MENKLYKNGDMLFCILGNTVVKCQVTRDERIGDRHLELSFNGKKVFKQKTYCFDKEIQALDDLEQRLTKALSYVEARINKIIQQEIAY